MLSIRSELEEIEASENLKVQELMKLIRNTTRDNLLLLQKFSETAIEKQTAEVYQNQMKQEYKMIVEQITKAIENKLIEEKHISLLLMVNGFATQTIRQLFRVMEKVN